MSVPAKFERAQLMAPEAVAGWQSRSLIVGVVAALLSLVGLAVDGAHFTDAALRAYLVGFMFWLGLSAGSLGLLMLTYVVGGWWGFIPRRLFQSAARNFPMLAVLFIPIALGMKHLYIWTDAVKLELSKEELALWKFQSYLTPHGFVIRAAIYFILWIGMTYFLTKWSDERDNNPGNDRAWRLKFQKVSAPGLVIFCLAMTFASFDWVMSLDPRWSSTIYGMIFISGQALSTFAFVILVCVLLAQWEPMASFLKPDILHDFGKMMFAFLFFWLYVSFSQLLIIWSGNLPEETRFYDARWGGSHSWKIVSILILLFHFVVPYALLLSKDLKKKKTRIALLGGWILMMRLLFLNWEVHPMFNLTGQGSFPRSLIWLNVTIPIAIGGIWLWMFFGNLRKRPLLPLNDPMMVEAMHHIEEPTFQHQH